MPNSSEPEKSYTYVAFISYKSEDAKYAKRLKRDLHSYRLPAKTRKANKGINLHCKPVFLDKTNLTPGLLDEELRSEVQDSKYLIVICSRNAKAHSKHLDDELRFFLEGGGDRSRIIPFIIDKSDHTVEECFPKGLADLCKEEDIVGANIHDAGWRTALLKVIASILGIKRVELEADDYRRRKFYRYISAVLCVAALIGGFFCWDFFRTKTKYYIDYTEKSGIPTGIGELDQDDIKSMYAHYTIIESCRKVRELRRENSSGSLMEPEDDAHIISAAKIHFEYNKNNLVKTTFYNSNEKFLYTLHYKNRSTADLEGISESGANISQPISLSVQSTQGDSGKTGSNVMRYCYFYDDNDYVQEIHYALNTWNETGTDTEGISGLRFQRDDLGRVTKMEYLTHTGSGSADSTEGYSVIGKRNGIAGIEFIYDGYHNTKEIYIDANGNKTLCEYGYSSCENEYNETGNLVKVKYCGTDGKLTLHTEYGYAASGAEYNDRGYRIKITNYDKDYKPAQDPDGIAIVESGYDDNGNCTSSLFLGTDGKPVLSRYGTTMKDEYDDRNNLIKRCYVGPDGKPFILETGYTGWESEFDEQGNQIKLTFLGTDWEPTYESSGITTVKWEYDSNGDVKKTSYFGANDELILSSDGYAGYTNEYDKQRNLIKCSYFGINNESVLCTGGYAGWKSVYDAGNEVRVEFFGTDNKPVLLDYGYAGWECEYDQKGNPVKVNYFGVNNEAVLGRDGYAGWTSKYDEKGNLLSVRYFGRKNAPIENNDGYAGWDSEFDERGNQIRVTHLGLDEKPIMIKEGYSIIGKKYDERNNQTSCSYFGIDGKPVLIKDGYSVIECVYDGRNREIFRKYYGINGEPILCSDGYASRRKEYDEKGNNTRLSYYGINGEPVMTEMGYASMEIEYDEKNNETGRKYFETDGTQRTSTEIEKGRLNKAKDTLEELHTRLYGAQEKDYADDSDPSSQNNPAGVTKNMTSGNFHERGNYVCDGKDYYYSFDGHLYKCSIDDPSFKSQIQLSENIGFYDPFLNLYKGYIYYIPSTEEGIYRCNLHGANQTMVFDGSVDSDYTPESLYLYDDWWYFSNKNNLYRVSAERINDFADKGPASQAECIAKDFNYNEDIYVSLCFAEGHIYYNGKGGLTRIDPDGSNRTLISEEKGNLITDGTSIFNNYINGITRIDPDQTASLLTKPKDGEGKITDINYKDGYIFYVLQTANVCELWRIRTDGTDETFIEEICPSDDIIISFCMFPETNTACFYILKKNSDEVLTGFCKSISIN